MRLYKSIIFVFPLGMFCLASSCNREEIPNKRTLKQLYKTYENGLICECMLNQEPVYTASINAYDAGEVIYNEDGDEIGTCNYAWGQPDEICGELTDCETIYCVEDNIWGQPAVDKYGISK